jgi:hypothetical protein
MDMDLSSLPGTVQRRILEHLVAARSQAASEPAGPSSRDERRAALPAPPAQPLPRLATVAGSCVVDGFLSEAEVAVSKTGHSSGGKAPRRCNSHALQHHAQQAVSPAQATDLPPLVRP